jgi:hypothetical protein
MKTTFYTIVLSLLLSHVYASAVLSKHKGLTVEDFFTSLSREKEFFGVAAEEFNFFTTPSEEMDRSPSRDDGVDAKDTYSTYVIFCNGIFSASANRCGGVCTSRWIEPNTCTAAPGTNCVELNRNNAKDFDVRNRPNCMSGDVTRLANLPKNRCRSEGGCYNTPDTQSFFYFGS